MGVEVEVGTKVPGGVVLLVAVGVGVPVDSGAGAGVSEWGRMGGGRGRTCVLLGCGEVNMVQPFYCGYRGL